MFMCTRTNRHASMSTHAHPRRPAAIHAHVKRSEGLTYANHTRHGARHACQRSTPLCHGTTTVADAFVHAGSLRLGGCFGR